jgi:hypothetical protein
MRSAVLFISVLKDNGIQQIRKKNTSLCLQEQLRLKECIKKCEGNYYRETQNEIETTMQPLSQFTLSSSM